MSSNAKMDVDLSQVLLGDLVVLIYHGQALSAYPCEHVTANSITVQGTRFRKDGTMADKKAQYDYVIALPSVHYDEEIMRI